MKFFITILALLALVTVAFAGDVNLPIIPKASKSACKSIAAGRATQASVTVGTAKAINWTVYATPTVSSPGTATVVKKKLATSTGTNSAYMQASSGTNEKISGGTTSVVFERYSSDTTLNLCYELD